MKINTYHKKDLWKKMRKRDIILMAGKVNDYYRFLHSVFFLKLFSTKPYFYSLPKIFMLCKCEIMKEASDNLSGHTAIHLNFKKEKKGTRLK